MAFRLRHGPWRLARPISRHPDSLPRAVPRGSHTRKLSARGSASGRLCPPSVRSYCADHALAFATSPCEARSLLTPTYCDKVNASGLRKLLLAAAAFNAAKGKGKEKPAKAGGARTGKPAAAKAKPARHKGRRRRAPGSRRSQNARPPAVPGRSGSATSSDATPVEPDCSAGSMRRAVHSVQQNAR